MREEMGILGFNHASAPKGAEQQRIAKEKNNTEKNEDFIWSQCDRYTFLKCNTKEQGFL